MKNKQLILGHRGYSDIAPENTQLAFNCAKEFGFDGVELDVHLTKDNKLVIVHDETIDRTSDKKGFVKDLTLKQLEIADFGANFKIKKVPFQKIMTLENFLNEFIDHFKVINIEVKTDEIEYKGIEAKIVKLLDKYSDKPCEIILSSFNFNSLRKLRKMKKSLKLGFLWWEKKEFDKIEKEEIISVCDYIHPWTKLYVKNKKEYDRLGLKYHLWTIDSQKDFEKFCNDGNVLSLISNKKY